MTGKSLKNLAVAGVATLALAVTVAAAVPAVTQAQTSTPTTPSQTAPANPDSGTRPGKVGRPGGELGAWGDQGQYLAGALGITAADLTAAQEKARVAAIDEALAQGLITQAQADALKNGAGFGRGRGMGGLLFDESKIDTQALLAKALNISVEQLQAAQEKAYDAALAAAVTAGNLTQEQADLMKAQRDLATYITSNNVFEQVVKQAVSAGAITQAQADAILAAQQNRGGMHGFGGFGGFGEFRGHGRMGGMRAPTWAPQSNGSSTAPSTSSLGGSF